MKKLFISFLASLLFSSVAVSVYAADCAGTIIIAGVVCHLQEQRPPVVAGGDPVCIWDCGKVRAFEDPESPIEN
ncbi:MAG: hypothetical protein K1X72_13300 [Pyrinomonadaceae bacterium]|nr:hypothetical protein [Pyrinomonadaceae bacterium]